MIMGGDAEMVQFLQRVVGYTLTGGTSEQCLFVLYGTGANGKTALLTVLQQLLGEYGRTAEFRSFLERKNDAIRNDLAWLAGAQFVAGAEGDAGQALSEAVVKSLTGGDTIAARFLHKEYFEFVPCFKLFLATNHKPYIAGQDEGIWRRIRLMPFEVTIPPEERDPHLVEDQLVPELPGILAWAVQGCQAWQDRGLQPPERVLAATDEYREEMDTLAPFLEDCFDTDADAWTATEEIYKIYVRWSKKRNIKKPLAQNTLISRLKERGYCKKRSNAKRGLSGLHVKEHWRGLDITAVGGYSFMSN
jgi:putative DNA primase/helicase